MTPERARELIAYGQPNERADCSRCFRADVLCYLEPLPLWSDEPTGPLCAPCVDLIGQRRAKAPAAPTLSLNL